MNENRTSRISKKEIFEDSPDVIVPISAERRHNNPDYYDDGDYIFPISDDEYEEYYEDAESVDYDGTENVAIEEDYSNANAQSVQEIDDPESPYYYSAVGIDNALKKNAVQYPRNNDINQNGLAGKVSSIKNEMLYLKASMDEIENPTEREMVYVIDRSADDEFYKDPYDTIVEPIEGNTQITPEDSYDSLFTSKKHEYLDKIEEYTNASSSDAYADESINDGFLEELTQTDYAEESEPIIPITSPANHENISIQPVRDEFSDIIKDDDSIKPSSSVDPIESEYSDDDFIDIDELDIESEAYVDIDEIDLNDDEFEDIITDVGQDYQELEDERIKEANVLSAVDNTRLTPSGKISDYVEDYKEIEDVIIKSPAEIYDDEKKLATAVMDIVAAEDPVHVDTVIRRLRESCGLSRAGTKFKNTILESIDRNESHNLLIRENDFLFIDYDSVKVRKRVKPNIDLISEVEIEKTIDLVMSFEKSLKVPELAKTVSRTLGFRSTSKKTSNKITVVIDSMIGKGILINNNGKTEFR